MFKMERTFSIVKPDGVKKNVIGKVIDRYESAGLKVVGIKMAHLTRAQAEGFYAVHKERPFFGDLIEFMLSGPLVLLLIEGDNAIKRVRELMGATNPKEADPGTIRADFAESIDANIAHGSDAPETAAFEIGYFFNAFEQF
jgi:nucleoside-diphosphate kinase